MDLTTRLAIVAAILVLGAAVTAWYRRRVATDTGRGASDAATGASLWPTLPAELHSPAGSVPDRATWVIFSTPLCVSCGAVQADLERHFPHHRVLKVDATERPDLADLYEVRRAPTTIVADVTGTIVERLVGPESIRDFIGTSTDPALFP